MGTRVDILGTPVEMAGDSSRSNNEEELMAAHSDAFVFFGATGDLAYKKIFPALQEMVRHNTLNVPVIGVAKSGWTVEQLRERARDSVIKYGDGLDDEAFGRLCELMDYVDGDYKDDKTYQTLHDKLAAA